MTLVNKKELSKRIALDAGTTQELAGKMIDAFSNVIKDTLVNDEEIMIVGLGKWSTKVRQPATYTLPDGQIAKLPAYKYPVFSFGKPIKDAVKEMPIE